MLLVLDEGASGGDGCSCMELRRSLIKQTAVFSLCRDICEQWFVSEKIDLVDPCDTADMRGINSNPQLAVDIVLRCYYTSNASSDLQRSAVAGQVADKIVRAQAPPPIATCLATTNCLTSSVKID